MNFTEEKNIAYFIVTNAYCACNSVRVQFTKNENSTAQLKMAIADISVIFK